MPHVAGSALVCWLVLILTLLGGCPSEEYEEFLDNGEGRLFAGIRFVWIPPGTLMMGAYGNEQDSDEDERPQHQVTLTQGFWLSKYEITKAEWTTVMATEPWRGGTWVMSNPHSPAVYMMWHDANDFIDALNAMGEGTFRLPTEAEWEYACRAGTETRFHYGDDPDYSKLDEYAWYGHDISSDGQRYAYAHVVGQKRPNAWGLYDMHGNVCEWCQDAYDTYRSVPQTDPQGPGDSWTRVVRGGAWSDPASACRSAARAAPSYGEPRSSCVGLRLVRIP